MSRKKDQKSRNDRTFEGEQLSLFADPATDGIANKAGAAYTNMQAPLPKEPETIEWSEADTSAAEVEARPNRARAGSEQALREVAAIDQADLVSIVDTRTAASRPYFSANGEQIASSRQTPVLDYPYRPGTWRIDDHFGTYGREVERLEMLDPHSLELSEEDYTTRNDEGRGDDAARYAEWIKEGKMPPPIDVVETEEGRLRVSEGHRRVAAAKLAGVKIPAWVSYAMHTGRVGSNDKPIMVGLTYEGARYGAEHASRMWEERRQALIEKSRNDEILAVPTEQTTRPQTRLERAIAETREKNRAREEAAARFFEEHGEVPFQAPIEGAPNRFVIAHQSTKYPGKWQFSLFDEQGPVGDMAIDDYREGLLWQLRERHVDLSQATFAPTTTRATPAQEAAARLRAEQSIETPAVENSIDSPEAEPRVEQLTGVVPNNVRKRVEGAVDFLRGAEEELARARGLDKQFGAEGRYESETFEKLEADIKKEQSLIVEFRKLAPSNNVDADAFLKELGGVPEVRMSSEGEAWRADQSQKYIAAKSTSENVKAIRFEAGRQLTAAEKDAVLKSLGDSYKDLRAPQIEKGINKFGELIVGYEYNPDYMYTSDITGRPIRYYVELPDGRIAHPTELYPNLSKTEIDEYAMAREAEDALRESRNRSRDQRIASPDNVREGSSLKGEANARYQENGRKIEGSYFAEDEQGQLARVDGKDADDVAYYESQGFKPISQWSEGTTMSAADPVAAVPDTVQKHFAVDESDPSFTEEERTAPETGDQQPQITRTEPDLEQIKKLRMPVVTWDELSEGAKRRAYNDAVRLGGIEVISYEDFDRIDGPGTDWYEDGLMYVSTDELPWEISREQFARAVRAASSADIKTIYLSHYKQVEEAIEKGKDIYPSALADYPELLRLEEDKNRALVAALRQTARPEVIRGKEPWEMTQEEFNRTQVPPGSGLDRTVYERIIAGYRERGSEDLAKRVEAQAQTFRKAEIKGALYYGKPVPPEILAEYPDLQPDVVGPKRAHSVSKESPFSMEFQRIALSDMDSSVFQDYVPRSIQNDGQALLDALKTPDQETIQGIYDKYIKEAVRTQGGGGAGPGKEKTARSGVRALLDLATSALDKLRSQGIAEAAPTTSQPLILYHGTTEDFETFQPLTHFETQAAAETRLKNIGAGEGRLRAAEVLIKNPLRIEDFDIRHHLDDLAYEAYKAKAITFKEYIDRINTAEGFVSLLESKGYDGIVYQNTSEGAGSDSWIIFHPEQAREIALPGPVAEIAEDVEGGADREQAEEPSAAVFDPYRGAPSDADYFKPTHQNLHGRLVQIVGSAKSSWASRYRDSNGNEFELEDAEVRAIPSAPPAVSSGMDLAPSEEATTEAPATVKEVRKGDILEYQDRKWSVVPLGSAVVMTAIGDDGKALSGPDNIVVFDSHEKFEDATGCKPIARRPAEQSYVQRINVNQDFIDRVTNGRVNLFTSSDVKRVILKLNTLQEKFLTTYSEKKFADLRQHFEFINKTMNRLASELHLIQRGHEKANPASAEETRNRLEGLLNASDGETENLSHHRSQAEGKQIHTNVQIEGQQLLAAQIAAELEANGEEVSGQAKIGTLQPTKTPTTVAEHLDAIKTLRRGELSAADAKRNAEWLLDNEAAIKAELSNQTVANLKRQFHSYYARTKADWVKAAYGSLVQGYTLDIPIVYQMFRDTPADGARRALAQLTDERIQKYAAEQHARIEATRKALTNPETLDEFEKFIQMRKGGENALTAEQRARYDRLIEEKDRDKGVEKIQEKVTVKQVDVGDVRMEIKKHYHTKMRQDVYIVTLSDLVDRPKFNDLNNGAKRMGGWYSRSYQGSPAGFAFRTEEVAQRFVSNHQGAVSQAERAQQQEEEKVEKAHGVSPRAPENQTEPHQPLDRASLIDRIIDAYRASEPLPKIVQVIQHQGDNGKWYSLGVPHSVKLTGESRVAGYAYQDKHGVRYGQRCSTEEELIEQHNARIESGAADLRRSLEERTDEGLQQASDYWLGKQERKAFAEKAAAEISAKEKQKVGPSPAESSDTGSPETDQRLAQLRSIRDAGGLMTAAQENLLELYEKRASADPLKWKVGDGVGYRVYSGGKSAQINRGFRIVQVDPASKRVLIRQVADTGITTSGGDHDVIQSEWAHIADLVRDRAYDAANRGDNSVTADALSSHSNLQPTDFAQGELGAISESAMQELTATNALSPPTEATPESRIARYSMELAEMVRKSDPQYYSRPGRIEGLEERSRKIIESLVGNIEAKNVIKLAVTLHTGNPFCRNVFEQETGVSLGKRQGDLVPALKTWAGAEGEAAFDRQESEIRAERERRIEAEHARTIEDKKYTVGGRVVSARQMIDDFMGEPGEYSIETAQRGAVKSYWLTRKADGRTESVRLDGVAIREYAESAIAKQGEKLLAEVAQGVEEPQAASKKSLVGDSVASPFDWDSKYGKYVAGYKWIDFFNQLGLFDDNPEYQKSLAEYFKQKRSDMADRIDGFMQVREEAGAAAEPAQPRKEPWQQTAKIWDGEANDWIEGNRQVSVGDSILVEERQYTIDSIAENRIKATDYTMPVPIGRVWENAEHFERSTGLKIEMLGAAAQSEQSAIEPTARSGWRENLFRARDYANALNVMGRDKDWTDLDALVALIDQELARRNTANISPAKQPWQMTFDEYVEHRKQVAHQLGVSDGRFAELYPVGRVEAEFRQVFKTAVEQGHLDLTVMQEAIEKAFRNQRSEGLFEHPNEQPSHTTNEMQATLSLGDAGIAEAEGARISGPREDGARALAATMSTQDPNEVGNLHLRVVGWDGLNDDARWRAYRDAIRFGDVLGIAYEDFDRSGGGGFEWYSDGLMFECPNAKAYEMSWEQFARGRISESSSADIDKLHEGHYYQVEAAILARKRVSPRALEDYPQLHELRLQLDDFRDSKALNQEETDLLTVYHGTDPDVKFEVFDPSTLGSEHGSPSSSLGFVFSSDIDVAKLYGKKILCAQLNIANPYYMTWSEFEKLDTASKDDPRFPELVAQARNLQAELIENGHDGIEVGEVGYWIPFRSDQIRLMRAITIESLASHKKEPWQQTAREYLGRIDHVDELLGDWNEERFQLGTLQYIREGGVIHKSEKMKFGYLFGEPNIEGALAHYEYLIGRGIGEDKGKFFLLAEKVVDDGRRMYEGPVGEYSPDISNGIVTSVSGSGIIAAHRGKGAGKAFFKELMKRGEFAPENWGFSPAGLVTVTSAHWDIIRDAFQEGKPVPTEVLADYRDRHIEYAGKEIEFVGGEKQNNGQQEEAKSIRPSEVRKPEGIKSQSYGRRDGADSGSRSREGERVLWGNDGERGRSLGSKRADIARSEPGRAPRTEVEADENSEYAGNPATPRRNAQAPSIGYKPETSERLTRTEARDRQPTASHDPIEHPGSVREPKTPSGYLGVMVTLNEDLEAVYGKTILRERLNIKNPYPMTWEEIEPFETVTDDYPHFPVLIEKAKQLRERLEQEGYDGIEIEGRDTWIAFHPDQIGPHPKLAAEIQDRPDYVDKTDPSRTVTQPPSAARKPENYEITDPGSVVPRGKRGKLDANVAAIQLLRELQAEGRTPTKPEQDVLSHFSGWGQHPALFNEINDAGKEFAHDREELKALLGERDYERAKASTINAHYTSLKIVDKMWHIVRRLGFKGGRVIEPAIGAGYFYGLMPRDLMAASKLAGVELDPTSGAIARMLYPNASIHIKGFQDVRIPHGFYDLAITNVPFSENVPFDPDYRKLRAPLHDYYLVKLLDKVREGGFVAAITSSYTLDKAEPRFRRAMAERGDLIAAFRFPDTAFKENAGTEVVTDLLIFRKRKAGEKVAIEPASSDYSPDSLELEGREWTNSAKQRIDSKGRPIVGKAIEGEIAQIQYEFEWKGKKQAPDSDIRLLRQHGWRQESQTTWVTPLVKYGQSSDWTKLGELPDPDDGAPIPINNYYVKHPEHILGILDRKSKLYRPNEPHVSGTADFAERFEKAIASLPENIFGAREIHATEPEAVADALISNVVEGGYILRDGQILQRQGDVFISPNFTPAEEAKAKRLIPVRDALNALNAAQLKGEDTAEARRALNRAYDHFILWHGPIRKGTNAKLLSDDPSSYLLLALETSYDTKRQKATKADIFTRDTIARVRHAKDVSTPAAAIAVNLFESGSLDISRIADLLKVTPEEASKRLVAEGLAYEDPKGAWQTAEAYLSGNVRKKLNEAREAAELEGKYWANVQALEKALPGDVPMEQIRVKLGAGWVPAEDIKNFAGHLMQTDPGRFNIRHAEGLGIWMIGWGGIDVSKSSLAREVYGTNRADFMDVLDAALNDRPIKIYDSSVLNKDATDAANEKVKEVREQFADWVWMDDERATRLHRYYNDNFNNMRVIEYTGAHYANEEGKYILPGMNPGIALRPNQVKDIWQAVANGKLLDASEVGAGKTWILGAIAMEWKRLGIARKPAIAVPKPRIADTVKELQLLYPAAKILSLEKSFDAENRKRTTAMIATGDYDIIVLSHEQLDKAPMPPEVIQEFIGAELEELEQRIKDAEDSEDADSRAGNRIVKRLEKIKERVEAKLQEALDLTNKDDVVYFTHTGIDALLVDEAHAFKSLPVYSRRSEVKGVPSTRSDRATSMYMRVQWLMRQNNNKGVVFATGTPVTNTLAEVYNMQRYIQPELLADRGIENFDGWMDLFADVTTDFEYTASGEYKPVTRLAEFVNLPELQQMIRQHMATNFVDEMNWIVRPKKNEYVITSPMTEAQVKYLQHIRKRVEALKHMTPKQRKESGENYLLISTDARKSALSPLLIDPRATESGSKIEKVADKVLEIHRARPGVAQMIFLDYGVNPNQWSYSVYDDIQNRLIEGGIPKEKIANFGRMSDGARQKAAEKLNAGKYLVAIGSSAKMGTGINAQKLLAALHHVDAPWLPAFVEQRNGRGHRQENMNDPTKSAEDQTVEVYYYTTEGSFDVVMWQALTRKSSFIREFMVGDMSVREMRFEDTGDEQSGELGPEMILAATSGNPYELDRVSLITAIARLENVASRHRAQQSRYRTKIANFDRNRAEIEERIKSYEADIAQYEATKGQEFSVTFNGKTYSDRKVAGNQLAIAIAGALDGSRQKIGTYRGYDLYIGKDGDWQLQYLTRGERKYHFNLNMEDPTSAFNSADYNLRKPIDQRAQALEDLAVLERDVETAKVEVEKPFKRADELQEKREKLREIQQKIEELCDQKPGRDVRKLASRLETLKPMITYVQGKAYDIAQIRQSMADVAPNKAAFDRWLLALQKSEIVYLEACVNIAQRGDPEAYIQDPETGRHYSDLMMNQGWEPKAANVPPLTVFIEAEAQAEDHIYDFEDPLASITKQGSITERPTTRTRADVENSPEFKRWFGNSVVTETRAPGGPPLVMYHATGSDFDSFRASGYRGAIFFSTSPEQAQTGAQASQREWVSTGADVLMPVYLSVEKLYGRTYSLPDSVPDVAGSRVPYQSEDDADKVEARVKDAINSAVFSDDTTVNEYARTLAWKEWQKFHYWENGAAETGSYIVRTERPTERRGRQRVTLGDSAMAWQVFERGPSYSDHGNIGLRAIRALGYDGAIISDEGSVDASSETVAVFEPAQIKSAIGNRGTFDRGDPSILASAQRGGRAPGAYTLERSAYWGTPPVPRDEYDNVRMAANEAAEHIEYSRAEFRQHATRYRVYVNEQGAITYATILKKLSNAPIPVVIDGLFVPLKHARGMVDYLRDQAELPAFTPVRRQVYNSMTDQLALAIDAATSKGDEAITVVSTDALRVDEHGRTRRSLRAVLEAATHEETHGWALRIGGRRAPGLFPDAVIMSDPDYERQRQALAKPRDSQALANPDAIYPEEYLKPGNVLGEAMAIMVSGSGRYKDLGYESEAEGLVYLERVFDKVYTDYGPEALCSLRLRTTAAKGVRENVISRGSISISRGAGISGRMESSGGEFFAAGQVDGREIADSRASLRGREGEGRRSIESVEGEIQRAEPSGGGGRVTLLNGDAGAASELTKNIPVLCRLEGRQRLAFDHSQITSTSEDRGASGSKNWSALDDHRIGGSSTLSNQYKNTIEPLAALRAIANILKSSDPRMRGWELALKTSSIACEGLSNAGTSCVDVEIAKALKEITGLQTRKQDERLFSAADHVNDAVKIASSAIEKIVARELGSNIGIKSVEMDRSCEQEINWV